MINTSFFSRFFMYLLFCTILVTSCHPSRDHEPSDPSAIGIVEVKFINMQSETPMAEHYIEVDAQFADTGHEELLPVVTNDLGIFRGTIERDDETFISLFTFRLSLNGTLHTLEPRVDLPITIDQPYPEVSIEIQIDPFDPGNDIWTVL